MHAEHILKKKKKIKYKQQNINTNHYRVTIIVSFKSTGENRSLSVYFFSGVGHKWKRA